MNTKRLSFVTAAILIVAITGLTLVQHRLSPIASSFPIDDPDAGCMSGGQPLDPACRTPTPAPHSTEASSPEPTTVAAALPDHPASVPLCTNHDSTTWHGLLSVDGTCHYDHTHNADPSTVDHLFGPVAYELSYPWQTPHENEMKHQGYKYDVTVVEDLYASYGFTARQRTRPDSDSYISAWRVQYHAVGGATGATTRFHSFYLEARICALDTGTCGIVKTGGWNDFGVLAIPYKGERVTLASDTSELKGQSAREFPYRGHQPATDAPSSGGMVNYTWNSDSRYGWNQFAGIDFRAGDDFGGIDSANPSTDHFVCPDFRCEFNHSQLWVYDVSIRVPASLDSDGDGIVTYEGYTDLRGNVDKSCTEAGPECVPLILDRAPVGKADFFAQLNIAEFDLRLVEYDTSPDQEWWITYPN